jgi:hypothetical protein
MHGDASDFYRSASKSDWYFILATGLKLRSIYRIVYKFVWLKVASIMINISCITVDCIPLLRTKLLFVLNEINVSLNRNGLLFKKITFKIRRRNWLVEVDFSFSLVKSEVKVTLLFGRVVYCRPRIFAMSFIKMSISCLSKSIHKLDKNIFDENWHLILEQFLFCCFRFILIE